MNNRKAEPQPGKTGSTILGTKLYIPRPRANVVLRPRLLDCLDSGLQRRLVLVSAPAGFGKTTLLSHWIHHRRIPAAWLSLDSDDNDPVLFLKYIISALQTLDPEIGRGALTMIGSPHLPHLEGIIINLLNDILGHSRDMVLVMDDFHLINTKPVHELFTFLVEHCPPSLHLFVATRSDPNLPLARLRSNRQLAEIRSRDLVFNPSETSQFFKDMLDVDLSTEDVSMLESRVEGWIAGLQLVALLVQDSEDISGIIRTCLPENRYIGDYLIEEVLNRQPAAIQDFLMKTSVLDHLSAPLCDAVTGRSDSRETLEELEKHNLFIFPLDDRRQWYRYHQLFADLLQQRLRQTQPSTLSDLHRRACEWFAHNQLGPAAVNHALAAEDFELAARLIEEIGEIIWDNTLQSRQLEWFQRFPEDQLKAWPQLGVYYAAALLGSGRIQAAEDRLKKTEQILTTLKDRDQLIRPDGTCMDSAPLVRQMEGRIATVSALIATLKGESERTVRYSRLALETLEADDLMWRSMAAITAGMAHGWSGDGRFDLAKGAFAEAAETSRRAGNDYLFLFARLGKASILGLQGHLPEAALEFQKLLESAAEKNLEQTGLAGSIHASLGGTLCELDRIQEGFKEIEEGIRLTQENRDWIFVCAARLNKAHALYRADNKTGLESELKIIADLGKKHHIPPWIRHVLSGLEALLQMESGQLDKAAEGLMQRGIHPGGSLSYRTEFEYMVLGSVLSRKGRFQEARQLIDGLIDLAQKGNRINSLLQLHLCSVENFYLQGSKAEALLETEKLLEIAEPGRHMRLFVKGGEPLASLLQDILRKIPADAQQADQRKQRAFIQKILTVIQTARAQSRPSSGDALSRREMEVLELMEAGLSNQQIADRLFVSLNTVRTHTKNINSKLGTHSRTQAVAAAKSKGILA